MVPPLSIVDPPTITPLSLIVVAPADHLAGVVDPRRSEPPSGRAHAPTLRGAAGYARQRRHALYARSGSPGLAASRTDAASPGEFFVVPRL
jgi:hypothetical protein